MATHTTLFATVQTTISQLGPTLRDLQSQAPQGSHLANCYTTFQNLMRSLDANAAKKAADSANYLVNNLFSQLLRQGSVQEKLNAIDRYAANLPSKSASIRGMIRPIERLRDDILAGATALGGNPVAIRNHFTNIIGGIQSILGSYEQITRICTEVKAQVQGGDPSGIIQQETRWLTSISRDYQNFNTGF